MPSLFMMECMALKIGMLQIGIVFLLHGVIFSAYESKRVKFLFLIHSNYYSIFLFFNNVIMLSLTSEHYIFIIVVITGF